VRCVDTGFSILFSWSFSIIASAVIAIVAVTVIAFKFAFGFTLRPHDNIFGYIAGVVGSRNGHDLAWVDAIQFKFGIICQDDWLLLINLNFPFGNAIIIGHLQINFALTTVDVSIYLRSGSINSDWQFIRLLLCPVEVDDTFSLQEILAIRGWFSINGAIPCTFRIKGVCRHQSAVIIVFPYVVFFG